MMKVGAFHCGNAGDMIKCTENCIMFEGEKHGIRTGTMENV